MVRGERETLTSPAEPGWWGDEGGGDLADADAGGVGEDDWGQYYTPDV